MWKAGWDMYWQNSTYGWVNYGQRPFKYAPPAGFEPWSSAQLPDVPITNPSEHFKTVLYTGTGNPNSVSVGFQPDLVWIKNRLGQDHQWFDSTRGANAALQCNTKVGQANYNTFQSFDSNGFTVKGSAPSTNENTTPYVAWCWKKDPSAGFNIVTWSGNDVNGRAIPHGLGQTPAFIIVKNYDNVEDWCVWHKSFSATEVMFLNEDAGKIDQSAYFGGGANEQMPDATNFYIGSNNGVNGIGRNYIAYVWAEIPGYSSFGSHVGNGNADGPFVYTGLRPAWLLVKSNSSTSWVCLDSQRDPYNVSYHALRQNFADPELTNTLASTDLLSNGFKLRNNWNDMNSSNESYIYCAFAEHPFGGSNVAPSPAQ